MCSWVLNYEQEHYKIYTSKTYPLFCIRVQSYQTSANRPNFYKQHFMYPAKLKIQIKPRLFSNNYITHSSTSLRFRMLDTGNIELRFAICQRLQIKCKNYFLLDII